VPFLERKHNGFLIAVDHDVDVIVEFRSAQKTVRQGAR
jgi:hypothetical protein